MITCKQYRVDSKAALAGNWGMAIGLALIFSVLTGVIAAIPIANIILVGALAVGYCYAQIMLFRRGKFLFSDLFTAFDDRFPATIGLFIEEAIFIFLWSLLFVIPGIVAAYRYAMAPYILADHPEMSGIDCIRASKKLMTGKKGKLFLLDLSFIGWILLSILTFGILLLWIGPWMEAARANFYESIKGELAAEVQPAAPVAE